MIEKIKDYFKNNNSEQKYSNDNTSQLSLDNCDESDQLETIIIDPFMIRNISQPSEALQIAAVRMDAGSIQFIDNPSEIVQINAVEQFAPSIRWIDNPTEDVIWKAIKSQPYCIKYISNQSHELQEYVIDNTLFKHDFYFIIDFLVNPSDKLQLKMLSKCYTKNCYSILKNFSREDEQLFNREVDKMKIKRGPFKD